MTIDTQMTLTLLQKLFGIELPLNFHLVSSGATGTCLRSAGSLSLMRQVDMEPDCTVMSICPSRITHRLPRGPETEPQDLGRRG